MLQQRVALIFKLIRLTSNGTHVGVKMNCTTKVVTIETVFK